MKTYKHDMYIPADVYDKIIDYLNGKDFKALDDAPFFCLVNMNIPEEPGFVVQLSVLRTMPMEDKPWTHIKLFRNKNQVCMSKGKRGKIGGVYTVYDNYVQSKATMKIIINVLRGDVTSLDRN